MAESAVEKLKQRKTDSHLQEWLKQVREVAYDAEDVLDDFTFRFARGYMDGFYGKAGKIYNSMKNLKARHQISSEIKDIKARVGEISERYQRYQSQYGTQERGFSSSRQANADFDIRAQSLFIEEAQLVGIDKPKAELISKILDDHSQLKVVSVAGMGGLGKTTLVKKVYDDAAVKKQFQSHAWITVSQNFQFRDIIKNLIQQLYNEIRRPVPPEVESMNDIMLSEFVRDFLQERRYILVLDDVWSIDAWEAIKCVLPDCNTASRVVLTTRIADVASASCLGSLNFIYKMEPLSEKESWTLFCNRTFQSNDCPPNLEEVAKKILKKCEGLPLAIVAIGGVLALKDKGKTDEWEMIIHGFGGEADGSGKLDRIKRVLLHSYNDLPHYLKSCLLYLSIYLEDYPIEVDDILEMWIALGYVEEREGITRTDIAMRYMKELINRSLIQVKSTWDDGRLVTCGLHDFLREITVSKSKEQSFTTLRQLSITELRREDGKELLSSLLRLTYLRDLVISCIKEDEILDLQHSVSLKLGFLTRLTLKGNLERVPQWVTSLQSLRTLQLANSRLREDENVIGFLGHLPNLVSLSLYGAYEGKTLCFKVGGFRKLQTLELVQLKRLKWVRVEEESMPSLRNLQLVGCKLMQELPSGIQNLTGLRYLGFFDMSDELMHKVQNLDKQSVDYQTISHIPNVCTGYWINGQWEDKFL
ncbi:disease resistance protein RPM1-like [Coffea eugenioides]|nr:disease resistance protein RPM1-like [Coffea eugenioides]